MTVIKSYDPDAVCSKCGHDDVSTVYYFNPARLYSEERNRLHIADDEKDFHIRTCQRCRYQWSERALELSKNPVPKQGPSEGGKEG